MGISEITVPKQYVIVQDAQPTGSFEGQLWYDSDADITYIYNDGAWSQITLDVSSDIVAIETENAEQQIDIVELQANVGVTPIDHDSLISETFSDSTGFKDYVNAGNTDAYYNSTNNEYNRENDTNENMDDFEDGLSIGWSGTITVNNATTMEGNYYASTTESAVKTYSENQLLDFQCMFRSANITKSSYFRLRDGSGNVLTDMCLRESKFQYHDGSSYQNIVASPVPVNNTNYTARMTYNKSTQKASYYFYNEAGDTLICSKTNVTTRGGGASGVQIEFITNTTMGFDKITDNSGRTPTGLTTTVELDLPTITGTVTHTELVVNGTNESDSSITYKLNNGTSDDTEEDVNTKNVYNLTGVPTKLKILLNPASTSPSNNLPSIKSLALKLWKV